MRKSFYYLYNTQILLFEKNIKIWYNIQKILERRFSMINEKMYELGSKSSSIRELFEYGKKRKQEIGEENVFDYSLGNPSVPAPSIVNETLIELINNVNPTILHGYTSAQGDLNVREDIVSYLNEKYNTKLNRDLVYLTVGAAASLTSTLNAIINPNNEVICFAPFFPEYKVFIEKAGGILKIVKCIEPTFEIDYQELEKAINKNTKAIIINSPNNPTGKVIKEEELKKIIEIINKKNQEYNNSIFLISDEPYRELVYDDYKIPFVTNYYNNSIVCYSFSKSLSLPGERIGYVIVNPNCIEAQKVYKAIAGAARSLGYVCAPSLFQFMISKCLGYTSDLNCYKENRDILYNELTKLGYTITKPDGAFYLFVKSFDLDANKFVEVAKKYELLLVPSDSFGFPGYVRIAYCVSKKQIIDSLPAFEKLSKHYKESI